MAQSESVSSPVLPGFRHVLEAALLFGVLGGLADVSFLYATCPELATQLVPALRFAHAAEFLTVLVYLPYLLVILLVLRPIARIRKWPLELSLSLFYFMATMPAGAIFARRLAGVVAAESILVQAVKADYFFIKYIWLLVPVGWAIGLWLARIRINVDFSTLAARFAAFAVAVTSYLLFTPMFQGIYLLARANIYSEVQIGPESRLILARVLIGSLILFPIAVWIFQLIARRTNGKLLGILLLVLFVLPYVPPLIAGPPSAGTPPSDAQFSGRPANVILVSLDTARRDDIGCYGSEVVETPNIDSVAEVSASFDNAITPMPLTGPAHMSMLTGLQPEAEIGHGVKSNWVQLPEGIPTLATILDQKGYRTGAVIGGWPLSREGTDLHRGFHYFHDIFSESYWSRYLPDQIWDFTVSQLGIKYLNLAGYVPHGRTKRADKVTDQALEWLDGNADEPFFLFVHYYDPHYLYAPVPPWDTKYFPEYDGPYKGIHFDFPALKNEVANFSQDDIDHYRALYRGEISFMDQEFGRLLNWGDEKDIWDNTLLIIVADHGESFEHNYYFEHNDRVYEPLILVPLIIRDPDAIAEGISGNRVDTLVNVSDLYFTVLSFLGIDAPEDAATMHEPLVNANLGWDHDLLPLIRDGETRDRLSEVNAAGWGGETEAAASVGWEMVACQSFGFTGPGEHLLGRFFTFRFDDWKLIYGPDAEPSQPMFQLFDLASDPEELVNLFPERSQDEAISGIAAVLKEWGDKQSISATGPLSRAAREQLEALGYLNW